MTRFTKTKYDRSLTARSQLGQGVIALSALVGLILIPIIGIFSFEIARYQAGVQQLEANTDSAALAGAAMLVTSRFQKPTDRLRRFEEAEKAAENAFKSTFASTGGQLNIILGSTLTTSVNVGRGGRLQLGSQPGNAHDRPMWLDVMLELSYLAFLTDTTRVIAFEWSREAGGFGGGGENHHELSHHGGDAAMLSKLATIDRFHISRLARFLSFLKATTEGESHMLDRTLVMFGSGMNSGEGGDHSPKNLPLIVAGGAKLGLQHGQHLAFDTSHHPPLSSVLLTLIQAAGVERNQFQEANSRLTGLV